MLTCVNNLFFISTLNMSQTKSHDAWHKWSRNRLPVRNILVHPCFKLWQIHLQMYNNVWKYDNMFVFCKKKIHFSNAMILEQYKLLPSKMKLTDEKYNFKRNMFLSQIAIDKK